MGRYQMLVWTVLSVVAADQASKAIIRRFVDLNRSIPVIDGFFNITHILNPGGAFGIFSGGSVFVRNMLFVGFTIAAVIFVVSLYRRAYDRSKTLAFGLCLIVAGAVGNLCDRLRFGAVVDFLDFYIHNLHWPAFNLADSAVSVGTLLFAFFVLVRKHEF